MKGLDNIINSTNEINLAYISPTFHLAYQTYANIKATFPRRNVAIITTEIICIPVTANISATVQEHDYFLYSTNTISVFIENSDNSDPNPGAATYKLVCIPPAIIKSNPKLDLKNYNEVKQVLNLKH